MQIEICHRNVPWIALITALASPRPTGLDLRRSPGDPPPSISADLQETNLLGEVSTHELLPGGADVPVTEENRHEYARL